MIGKLRKRMGRLGVIMTFLAILFAAGPVLEAAACAVEGCGAACLEETTGVSASETSDANLGGCTDEVCMCAVGHCGQVAGIPVMIEAVAVFPAVDAVLTMAAEQVASVAPLGLERPPRA